MTPILTKSHAFAAAAAGNLFAIAATAGAALAAGVSAPIIGIVDKLGVDAATMGDVHHLGTYQVKAGGTIAAGDPLTSDSNGQAVKAVVTNSTVVWVGAIALEAGVSGDLVRCLIVQTTLSKPSA
jgi:hypothetical protein